MRLKKANFIIEFIYILLLEMNSIKKQFLQGSGYDNGSYYPAFDTLKPDHTYCITINPIPEIELAIMQTYDRVLEILSLFHANVKMYTEISTANQIIHYHGFLRFPTRLHIGLFYLNIKDIKTKCNFDLDTIGQLEQWWPYCIKSEANSRPLCYYFGTPYKIKYICDPLSITLRAAQKAREVRPAPIDQSLRERSSVAGARSLEDEVKRINKKQIRIKKIN